MSRNAIFTEKKEEREALVNQFLIPKGITDPAVIRVMKTVPRHFLVATEVQEEAYNDYPLSIGLQQTISQPWVVAKMTQQLKIKKGRSIQR